MVIKQTDKYVATSKTTYEYVEMTPKQLIRRRSFKIPDPKYPMYNCDVHESKIPIYKQLYFEYDIGEYVK